jgi:recombination protein RecR
LSSGFTPDALPVANLVEAFHKLPGIGPKVAQRLAYYLLRAPEEEARALAEAILDVKEKIRLCSRCFNITDIDPCAICRNEGRDRIRVCVVERPLDIVAIERTGKYKGLYHVLHGALAPNEGVGPEDLKVKELLARLQNAPVQEVILATNPNMEGETTAMYLQRILTPLGIKVTRLARGLPFGADLEYADEVTLSTALEGRQPL